jgi:SAM-dependent methyltransferase
VTGGAAATYAGSPLAVYEAALHRVVENGHAALTAVDRTGRRRTFLPADWCGGPRAGDGGLLDRCVGRVLDVGCGPGRLTRALTTRGHLSLGVDISPGAVRMARRGGVWALRRNVFHAVPAEGTWARVLLADGNIGIGGDPVRLLRRCGELVAPGGRILAELDPPGFPTWAGEVRLAVNGGAPSAPLPWAYVGIDHLAGLARAAGLRLGERWTEAGRWFASLC